MLAACDKNCQVLTLGGGFLLFDHGWYVYGRWQYYDLKQYFKIMIIGTGAASRREFFKY